MVEPSKKKNFNEFFSHKSHDIYLNFVDEGLKITTVNQKTEKSGSALITASIISEISKGFVEDEESLFSLILEAQKNPSENMQLGVEDSALTISFMIEFPFKKKYQIKIDLKEEKEDPMERMRKVIQRQASKLEELYKFIESFQSGIDRTKIKKLNPIINSGGSFQSYYSIASNKKIATRNGNSNGTYYHLCAQNPFPQENIPLYYEVRITSPSYPQGPYIMVGFVTGSSANMGNANLYSYDGTYLFSSQGGNLYKSGGARSTGWFTYTDSVIKIYYDFSKKLFSFECDGNSLNVSISKSHYSEKFYPVIMSAYNLESIEFL